jgi:tRNA U38,U39,U40 pseudouridine synthase TruA
MVRLIVKALVDVGLNRKDVNYLKRILDLKEKPTNLESAPAQGLCLTKINYKKDFSK